ncbi:MAG: site-specific DNA-methyltransferase [Phycisphaerae bacterium]|nr:site-specific DNA-methyltransferase [Phycisphaerae bacterium]
MLLDHIYHQPCGLLAEIPDDSIDAIVLSPPYNLSYKPQPAKKHNINGYDTFDDHLPQDQYEADQIELLDACCRVLKPGGSVFYNHKERQAKGVAISPFRWVLKSKCELVQTIIWNRGSTHNIDPVRLYPINEFIFWLRKPGCRPRFNRACAKLTNIWEIGFEETRSIGHPAPFPVLIPLRCLKMAGVQAGDVVLDPYMGSGSTGVAAAEMGAHWIGYEISADYIRLARNRIAEAKQMRDMWKVPPAKPKMTGQDISVAGTAS